MISKFDTSTALLLIDVQKGVNDTAYYGGPTGRRNNLSNVSTFGTELSI